MVKGEGKCFAQIMMPDQMQECGCNFSFSVPSLAMILGFFWVTIDSKDSVRMRI